MFKIRPIGIIVSLLVWRWDKNEKNTLFKILPHLRVEIDKSDFVTVTAPTRSANLKPPFSVDY